MKRTYNWGNIVFAMFLGVFVLSIIVAALGYGAKARAIPLLVGSFTLIMVITTVLSELNPKIRRKFEVGLIDYEKIQRLEKRDQTSTKVSAVELWTKILVAFGWTTGALFAIYLVGFHIAISLFCILFLKFHGQVSWFRSLVLTGILYGSVYLFFVVLLDVELYEGILFGAAPPSF